MGRDAIGFTIIMGMALFWVAFLADKIERWHEGLPLF
jgi:hypothetical protein